MKHYTRHIDAQTWAKWAAAALLPCLAVAAMRGCIMAQQAQPNAPQPEIAVYSHTEGRTVSMTLDEYLVGVVGAEMPAAFPLDALKAQAVAARTYAARRMAAYGGEGCGRGGADICTNSACCQAYRTKEQLEERFGENSALYMDKLREAVYSTTGEVIRYKGELIEALYHSAAGGRTEDAQNVFSSALPYLVGVESPGEEGSSKYTAEATYSPREFASLINKSWPKAGLKKSRLSKQVKILSRYESGQVEKLRLGGVTVTGKQLRKALGLNSANFDIDIGDSVTVCTTGYGHGVGMSQYGARAMALDGSDYIDILTHYYTGVEIGQME